MPEEIGMANETQVGGDHYKTGGEEHWDRVRRLGLDYMQGQITKYVERWKKKNGIQDLRKARHFLDKYIEQEELAEKEAAKVQNIASAEKSMRDRLDIAQAQNANPYTPRHPYDRNFPETSPDDSIYAKR